jgi:O-antigen/teichoic acid export membrane protein
LNQPWTKYLPSFLQAKLEGRAYLQNVVSNTGWQFADNALRMAVGLVVGVWLARYLGPEQFGLLSYAMALVAMFGAVANLGLDDIMVRDLVRETEARDEILGTAFLLRLAAGTVSFIAAVATIYLLHPDDVLSQWLVGIIAAGAIFQAFSVIEYWFHSQVQAKYAMLAKSVAALASSLVKVGLLLSAAPLVAFAWAALLEFMLFAVGLVVAYRVKGFRLCAWRGRLRRAGALLRDSWPLMLSGMVILVYLRIDQVMLGEMAGQEEVGIYSVAVRLAEIWYFIPMAVFWSVYPSIVEVRAVSEELFYGRLQQLYNLMALLAYVVAVPVTLAAQWLVPTLFGDAYARAGLMLAVLVWANLFYNLDVARSAFLTVMSWTRFFLVTSSLGCVLNIVLNWWLIPLYGGMGAVIASLAAYWFAAHGSCFLFRPLFKTGTMLTRAIICPKIW